MRIYLLSLIAIIIISFCGGILVLLKISPQDFPVIGPLLFYFFFFLFNFSIFSILGYLIRRITLPQINKYILYNLSFRQAVLLAIFACLSAYFLHLDIFTWWLELFVLIILLIVEVFFTINTNRSL